MRSLSADAAIVAGPTLGASALAVWCGKAALAAAPPEAWLPHPLLLLPLYAALGFALTWLFYYAVVGLLEYRALSTSNGRGLFMLFAALAAAYLLFRAPELVSAFAAAAAGATFALHVIRRRPRQRISAN
jgi:hypothetical protein